MEFAKFGKLYKVDKGDRFMDNRTGVIQFLPLDETKRPAKRSGLMSWRTTVSPLKADWERMKPLLEKKEFDTYDVYTRLR